MRKLIWLLLILGIAVPLVIVLWDFVQKQFNPMVTWDEIQAQSPEHYPSAESEAWKDFWKDELNRIDKVQGKSLKDRRLLKLRKTFVDTMLSSDYRMGIDPTDIIEEGVNELLQDIPMDQLRDCVDAISISILAGSVLKKNYPNRWMDLISNTTQYYVNSISDQQPYQACCDAVPINNGDSDCYWNNYSSFIGRLTHNLCLFDLAQQMVDAAKPYIDEDIWKKQYKIFYRRVKTGNPDPTGSARRGCNIKIKQGIIKEIIEAP